MEHYEPNELANLVIEIQEHFTPEQADALVSMINDYLAVGPTDSMADKISQAETAHTKTISNDLKWDFGVILIWAVAMNGIGTFGVGGLQNQALDLTEKTTRLELRQDQLEMELELGPAGQSDQDRRR